MTSRIPGTEVGGRATVTANSNGVSADAQYNRGRGRTGISVAPDGVEQPESRFGGSVPGMSSSPVGAHASVGWTFGGDWTPTPSPDPAKRDSDGDGHTDGSLQESPELGGRQGMNFSGTGPNPLDSDMDGVVDRSDRRIGRDSDEDGVADQFDLDIGANAGQAAPATKDSDGDGNSDGSFAESPAMGGRGEQESYGADQSAPASDAAADTAGDGAESDAGDTGTGAGGF